MEITPLTTPKAVATVAPVTPIPQTVDTKVPTIAALDRSATALAQKPFIAPIVNAKLAGTSFSEKDSSMQAPERVLRPYSVPMLPYDDDDAPTKPASELSSLETAANDSPQTVEGLPKTA
ncbi:hypothetical protein DS901_11675 [Loktanella sp. D2R18]|uniref:hypothetical protein n=1 Tax=Rhodobacterales TaxID=204455 RepID=UPI000DEBB289|nr:MULTISPECIES: hypothetical protein [Rhodobacterales]MDO6590295.1 hypothetical protein [Yoonia sp. 1_MG-2023]RBW42900.1 hypothetical protein DS901_11675 [Loktanella sp. D2R18]